MLDGALGIYLSQKLKKKKHANNHTGSQCISATQIYLHFKNHDSVEKVVRLWPDCPDRFLWPCTLFVNDNGIKPHAYDY